MAAGRGVTSAEMPNRLNQLMQIGTGGAPVQQVTHDARGNTIAIGSTAYGYDQANRMVSGPNGVSLYYDPAGRLENYASTSGGTFAYDHDGPNLASEYAMPGGTRVKRYVWGPEPDELLVEYSGTNLATRTWSLQDERGSVVARADDTGTVTTTLSYDEYGTPAASNTGRFQYTGQAWLPELGLHHYKARMYAPGVGRFMQTDPIGYDDGINWYAYVGGDPVNGTDPSGLELGCVTLSTGCGYKDADFTGLANVLAGVASYPIDLAVLARHAVNSSGLTGIEAQNRSILVNDLARRSFDALRKNPAEAANRVSELIGNNKAFLVGRFGAGAAVTAGLGGRAGGGLGTAALAGGAIRALNGVVGQLERGGIDTGRLSDQTLGTVAAAGMAGASVKFDAKTGDVTAVIQSQSIGSRIPTRSSHIICNVQNEKGC